MKFNLSDKIKADEVNYDLIPNIDIEDVKEFIRLLKETLKTYMMGLDTSVLNREIDKLAGDKLNGT